MVPPCRVRPVKTNGGRPVSTTPNGSQQHLRIVLADQDEGALKISARLVRDLGHEVTEMAIGVAEAAQTIAREDPAFVAQAAERGIYAYAREGTPESIQSAIEVAIRRHAEVRALTEQVHRLESALERRAVIERAKGILMERHDIEDRAAFDMLREHARSRNRTVVDVASSVAEGHALLPKARG